MSETSKFTIRCLGTARIEGPDGLPLDGAAAQKRLLALLAVVALAGPAGISKDRVLDLLWTDSDPERARHALTQGIYHARRALRCDDIFLGSGELRLNPERATCDVALFDAANREHRLTDAIALYGGAFLDGFHLPNAAEFERWTDGHRRRLHESALATLLLAARHALAAGDTTSATAFASRAVSLDPLDSPAVVALMRAHIANGDRAGALQAAHLHEVLLHDELGVELPESVREIVEELRASPPKPQSSSPSRSLVRPAPPRAEAVHDPKAPVVAVPRRPLQRYKKPAFILAVVAAAVIGILTVRRDVAAAPPANEAIAILPFRVSGAAPSLRFLQGGMPELLAIRLGAQARVTAGGSLRDLTSSNKSQAELTADEVRKLGSRFAAGRVLAGTVIGSERRVIIHARIVRSADSHPLAEVTVEGTSDSLSGLVDQLAARLLASEVGEEDRIGKATTPSLSALRAYLRGRQAAVDGDLAAAVEQYERALRLDSTFALAAFRLALAADRMNNAEQHDRALMLAWRYRDELSERDRAHLVAFAGPRYPLPTPELEQLGAWERALDVAPDRAGVWVEYGDQLVRNGAVLDVLNADTKASLALRRALEIEPTRGDARLLLIELFIKSGRMSDATRYASPAAIRDSSSGLGPVVAWRMAVAAGNDRSLTALRRRFPSLSDANLRTIAMMALSDTVDIGDASTALGLLRARHDLGHRAIDAVLAQHSLALNSGDSDKAYALTEQLEDLSPSSRAHLRLRVLDGLYGNGNRGAAAAAFEQLRRTAEYGGRAGHAIHLADACVAAQWQLANRQIAGVSKVIEELVAAPDTGAPVLIGANPQTCGRLLEAWFAVIEGRRDAPQRVQAVDRLMLSGPAVGDASTYAHLLVSRMYRQLGMCDKAYAAIRRRPYLSGWPRYLSSTWIEERELAGGSCAPVAPARSAG